MLDYKTPSSLPPPCALPLCQLYMQQSRIASMLWCASDLGCWSSLVGFLRISSTSCSCLLPKPVGLPRSDDDRCCLAYPAPPPLHTFVCLRLMCVGNRCDVQQATFTSCIAGHQRRQEQRTCLYTTTVARWHHHSTSTIMTQRSFLAL